MQDLKHALRLFAKSPGFTLIVIATIALGIGATTAVFSIVNGTLLRPLPYKDPQRLISILDTSRREKQLSKIFASYSDFEEFSRHSHTLASLGALTWAARPAAILTGHGQARSYLIVPVTAGFFSTLGVSAQIGRTFTNNDLRDGCTVILSDKFWRGPLAANPRIVGQSLSLDNRSCTVLGVMPPSFVIYPPETQLWTLILPSDPRLKSYFGVFMIARLNHGVSLEQARAELTSLHTAHHTRDSNGEQEFTPLLSGLQDQFTWLAGRNLPVTLAILFAAVVLVLLIACLNVANLLLGRSFSRGREFAIRLALGSPSRRLLRQLLVESLLLASTGGALGILSAFALTRYFVHLQPIELPVASSIRIDLPTLAFATLTAIITALFFAVVPAWSISRGDIQTGLRISTGNTSPSRQLLCRFLIAAEMALSVVLLAGAGLLMRSILEFASAPLGFARQNIVASNASLPADYADNPARRIAFYNRLERELAALPGAAHATIASTLPPYGLGLDSVEIEGRPTPEDANRRGLRTHDVGNVAVTPGYFALFEIPLHRGRTFSPNDHAHSDPVAVINDAFAREYFPGQHPIGRHIRIGKEPTWTTVVGIVGNEKRPTVYEEMKWIEQPAVYRPVAQHPPAAFSVALGTTRAQAGIGRSISKVLESIDNRAALGDLEPVESRLAPYLKYPRFRAILLSAFSTLAIAFAAVGLYGVLAQFVIQHIREIGIRMAVGARAAHIAVLVARTGVLPVLAGLFIGIALSVALTRYLASLLYGVTPTDPGTFVATGLIVLAATAFATILPARRALQVDPITALRSE